MAGRLGLVVNPIAGMGGPIGLKGTDGWARDDLEGMGATARASNRATLALARLSADCGSILCAAGRMGADAVRSAGMTPETVYWPASSATDADDTIQACRALLAAGCDLILFAGGDGTARDVCRAVGQSIPTLGIPAGVKIHSGAFAASPAIAGETAAAVAAGLVTTTIEAEVVDLDEDDYRAGRISIRLHGYLAVPNRPASLQGSKVRSVGDEDAIVGLGRAVAEQLESGVDYLVGPGSTAKSVLRVMGLPFGLLGIDQVRDGRVVGSDLTEVGILERCLGPTRMIVSPIGGQGYIFGRGNQQLSPTVIRRVGKDGLIVVATASKLATLGGRPLRVDTGDLDLDRALAGFVRVVTGRDRETIYAVVA